MQGFEAQFKGKKITVMGVGVLGRGVGDIEFLATCGAEVIATDLRSESELSASIEYLKKYPNVSFHLGGHREEDFTSAGMVIKAAGVPLDSPYIKAAKKAGVTVAMSTALFAREAMKGGAIVVGVTGTRGKSTVTHMIHHALEHAGKKVHLGGNVRGLSTLSLLPVIESDDIVVLELDSWQLQGFGDLKISPRIAIFTNLMPDHLNYYSDMDAYFEDKANIFKYQKTGDCLIVGPSISNRVYAANPPISPKVPEMIPLEWILHLPGEHNRENASLARAALTALGLDDKEIHDGLASFMGVEGRLQFVREIHGIKIYNDNNATTPEATVAALKALGGVPLALIIGGSEKQIPLKGLIDEIKRTNAFPIVLEHSNYKGSERLAAMLQEVNVAFDQADSLEAAVKKGLEKITKGTLLFSPGFASFGMFKNEYERNDRFMAIVRALT